MSKYTNINAMLLSPAKIKYLKSSFQEKVVQQFLFHFNKYKDNAGEFKFGDEIEYTLISYDDKKKIAQAYLNANNCIKQIEENEKQCCSDGNRRGLFHEEIVRYQIESVPSRPFTEKELLDWEENMQLRRRLIQSSLKDHESAPTLSIFPRMCCDDHTTSHSEVGTHPFQEAGLDKVYGSKPRTKSLGIFTKTYRRELGPIKVPVFQDVYTTKKVCSIDCAAFTAGMHVTVQANNLEQARMLNDNFTVISPFMLSMSAASPIAKGYLLQTDTRWRIAGDCLSGLTNRSSNKPGFNRSQFGKVPDFLSEDSEKYNDLCYPMDEEIYNVLTQEGIDKLLARHYSTMFTQTPWYLTNEDLRSSTAQSSLLLENSQSTSWGAVRMKLPLNEDEGWQLEFRTCEVQMTDFQNAAFATFVVLFAKASCHFNLDLRMNISKVEENIVVANEIDSVNLGKFWFPSKASSVYIENCDEIVEKIYMDWVINGKTGKFEGLIPMIKRFLQSEECCYSEMECDKIFVYLEYLSDIAAGRSCTNATWIRNFVTSHREYKHDSIVSEELQYDLLKACDNEVKKKNSTQRSLEN